MKRYISTCLPFLFVWCLFFTVSACSGPTGTQQTGEQVNTATSSPTVASTPIPIPPLETNCPAEGTARAAVMPDIEGVKGNASIVYTLEEPVKEGDSANEGVPATTLKKYDPITRATVDLYQASWEKIKENDGRRPQSPLIFGPMLSTNAQWVIFKATFANIFAIQLVRVDGQGLQTIYCSPYLYQTVLSLSPDNKHLAFTEFSGRSTELKLIDLNNGKLQKKTFGEDRYQTMKWADNKSLYITHFVPGTNSYLDGHSEPYVLRNLTLASSIQSVESQKIIIPTIPGLSEHECQDFDISPDQTKLVYSDCVVKLSEQNTLHHEGPGSIYWKPVEGGEPQQVHKVLDNPVSYARFATDTSIVFAINNGFTEVHNHTGLWKVNIDGSGLTRLLTTSGEKGKYEDIMLLRELNGPYYVDWLHISPDGKQFAIGVLRSDGETKSSVFLGSLEREDATPVIEVVPQGDLGWDILNVVGWSSL